MALNPGSSIPDVTLTRGDSRTTVSLRDYLADGPLVVLFYPMAFSSTCTEELCTVADDYSAYQDLDATVVAISVDSPYVAARFADECRATFPFLSDFNRTAARAFDVLRPHLGELEDVSERAAFVVAPDGVIRYTWVGEHPGVFPPLQEIKQAVLGAR
jgi:glutaredoxin-dependent peroxiredoxin